MASQIKAMGLKSYDLSVSTAQAIQPTNGQTVFVQSCIVFADSANTDTILIGGPGTNLQKFPLAAGASVNLGDLFMGASRSEFDLGSCWVKANSGTQVLHVLHPEECTR